jgi:hypothetical protein
MIKLYNMDRTEAVYTFVDEDGSPPLHIASDRLRAFLEKGEFQVYKCPWTPSMIQAMEQNTLGVEIEHALRLPVSALSIPGIYITKDGGQILVDGAHRMWRRWKAGYDCFYAYVVEEDVWKHFVVADLDGDRALWHNFAKNAKIRS